MARLFLLFIIGFIFQTKLFSLEIDLTQSEKNIFNDTENIRVSQWKKLQSINTKIEILDSNIFGITYLSNVADPNTKKYLLEKSPLGLSNDPIRVKINILKAQEHMYLGDYLTAVKILEKELKQIDPRNKGIISWAYKILFQANRLLKEHAKSTEICLKMLYIGGNEEDLFPMKWKLVCSNEFNKEAMQIKIKNNYDEIKQKLSIWANSPTVKSDSKYQILSAIYIALSYRLIYSDSNYSIQYLQEAISHTKAGNSLIAKAYLALSLLKYEVNKKNEALAIIRFLSDDFKGYGENLKYFEKDEITRVLARLSLARFHAAMFNLTAAETWYNDVLNEESISGIKLSNIEYTKAQIEYAHILYLQKKYKLSAVEYRKAISSINNEIFEEFNESKSLYDNKSKIRISRFLLAKILSKSSLKNLESKKILLELQGEVLADLKFLERIEIGSSESDKEQIESILALASLAEEYGLNSNLVTTALSFKKAFYNLEQELRFIRSDLANAINVNDLSYSGILEARAISALAKVDSILESYKEISLELDQLEYQFWVTDKPGIKFAQSNRYELLKRFSAMNDELSKYKLTQEVDEKIFTPKFPLALKNLSRNIDNLNSELSSINYLYSINAENNLEKNENNEQLKSEIALFSIEKMYDAMIKHTIEERIFQISRSLKPKASVLFEKKYTAINETIKALYEIHSRNKEIPYSIGDHELSEAFKSVWLNIFSSLKRLELSLKQVKERIVDERKEILEKINEVTTQIAKNESTILMLNNAILKEYSDISKQLARNLIPRAKQFKDYIHISLAEQSNDNVKLLSDELEIIKQAGVQREAWINSLKKSWELDLMR